MGVVVSDLGRQRWVIVLLSAAWFWLADLFRVALDGVATGWAAAARVTLAERSPVAVATLDGEPRPISPVGPRNSGRAPPFPVSRYSSCPNQTRRGNAPALWTSHSREAVARRLASPSPSISCLPQSDIRRGTLTRR